jgi:hypothetical protein
MTGRDESSPDGGGDADETAIALCVDCGRPYVVEPVEDRGLHPIGTDGRCRCGNDDFERVADAEPGGRSPEAQGEKG